MRSNIFKFLCEDKPIANPPLCGERGAPRRKPMSDDWKKTLPFPIHWMSYLTFKLIVLALATLAALRLWGVI
jgi:hypothetical protein